MARLLVKRISFQTIKAFWIQTRHFGPDKKFLENIITLGPYTNNLKEPRFEFYGLFCESELIGVTGLCNWNDDWVRYRTINIREDYRGTDLGWKLLMTAYWMDWRVKPIFGWVRKSHLDWSLKKDFVEVDKDWIDGHKGMLLHSVPRDEDFLLSFEDH